nr:pre-mRNA-splicing factor ISY1 homolog [Tanacetum cinerariifolium]
STQGTRSRQASASESTLAEEPMQTTSQVEVPSYLEFDTCADDQPIVQSSQHPEWFPPQQKPPTLDRDWNKTLPTVHRSIQPWISELAKQADSRSSFNELIDTPLDFSNFLMNRLRVDTLTPELLAGPTYELMKGSCKSLIELKYHMEEVYKATTDQLDWVNPEGQQFITIIDYLPQAIINVCKVLFHPHAPKSVFSFLEGRKLYTRHHLRKFYWCHLRGRDYEDGVLEKVERGAEKHLGAKSRVGEEEDVVMGERREREKEIQKEKEKEFVGHMPLSDEKEIEKMVLEKKMELLSKYANEELLKEDREAKAILNIHH